MSDAEQWQMRTTISSDSSAPRATADRAARSDAPKAATPQPYPIVEHEGARRGLWSWLRGEKVLIWTVALLLGHAIARLINALAEDVIEPAFDRAFGDPDNKRPAMNILGAKIKVRHFFVAIVQFVLIIAIAYALSNGGRRDPAHFRPHDTATV